MAFFARGGLCAGGEQPREIVRRLEVVRVEAEHHADWRADRVLRAPERGVDDRRAPGGAPRSRGAPRRRSRAERRASREATCPHQGEAVAAQRRSGRSASPCSSRSWAAIAPGEVAPKRAHVREAEPRREQAPERARIRARVVTLGGIDVVSRIAGGVGELRDARGNCRASTARACSKSANGIAPVAAPGTTCRPRALRGSPARPVSPGAARAGDSSRSYAPQATRIESPISGRYM